ncbi:AAA family ATPase [Brachyspira sp.]|uniref:AAA family ATPase n=1 Tax=Brachyspira sp. TaxID=1977261 RepID=UPI003D7DFAE3
MAKEKLTNEQMELIFDTMENIYSGDIGLQEGVDKLTYEIGIFTSTSYQFFYNTFKNMKNGKTYKRGFNNEIIEFFINRLGEKYGKEMLKKSLEATKGNIKYWYEQYGNKSKGLLNICRKISEDNKIDISFKDSEVFPPKPKKYTKDNFLQEVYITENEYDKLVKLITEKKNIILQGSAGVGKTYAAKRLAYSIIGEIDKARVKMIQFHQSYSYEDFIMGYRPNENGFELKEGVFYKFCEDAKNDEENKEYFLIIDEINRGNISKIFGELFMLIENDKRGEGEALELIYKEDEKFFVPENLYIIGLMNTADRSLAMLDYALRRRFAFYDMKPAFDSEQFKKYQNKLDNDKFNSLIEKVKELNKVILEDGSLGEGFCIGHSYFCNLETIKDDKLSLIVEFELIPLLKEYWFDDKEKVNNWKTELRNSIK